MKTKSYPASMHLPTPGEIREQKETGCRTPAQSDPSEVPPAVPSLSTPATPEHPVTTLPPATPV